MPQNYTTNEPSDNFKQAPLFKTTKQSKQMQPKASSVANILAFSKVYAPIKTKQLKNSDFIKN